MPHHLDPADRARLALRLDVIADQLAEISAELAGSGPRWPWKHADRAARYRVEREGSGPALS